MRIIFILGLMSVFLLGACAEGALSDTSIGEPAFFEEAVEAEAFDESALPSAGAPAESFNVAGDTDGVVFQTGQVQERLIIRDGQMDIVVKDTEETAKAIGRLAVAKNGWVVNSDIYQSNGAKSGSISIRVPAEEFEATIESIRAMALEVNSESSSSQDVTEEFVDLQARVENLEATADRVRGFLDETKNVEEALAVNQELSRLESEIESLKARMQFLSQSAALSRLTIFITPDALSQPIEVGGWRPEGVARSAIDALLQALQGLGSIIIWGGIFCLPIAILIGVPLFFIIRFGVRRFRNRQLEKEDEEEDANPSLAEETTTDDEPEEEESPKSEQRPG